MPQNSTQDEDPRPFPVAVMLSVALLIGLGSNPALPVRSGCVRAYAVGITSSFANTKRRRDTYVWYTHRADQRGQDRSSFNASLSACQKERADLQSATKSGDAQLSDCHKDRDDLRSKLQSMPTQSGNRETELSNCIKDRNELQTKLAAETKRPSVHPSTHGMDRVAVRPKANPN